MMDFNLPPITKKLLIANVVMYVLFVVLLPNIGSYLALYFPFTDNFAFYQIITHMFMHGSPMHLFFNMFALYTFGSMVEQYLKERKYAILYFASGFGALILQFIFLFATNYNHIENLNLFVMVGASGAVFGVAAAFAVMYPNLPLMIMFIPIPIKAKYLIGGYMILEILLGLRNSPTDFVAHFAHVGGGIVGFFLTRYWMKNRFRID